MNNEDLIKLIDLYFDNELEKGKEALLFTSLGSNEEAREYFKKMNSLNSAVAATMQEFPQALEEKILGGISKYNHNTERSFTAQKVFTAIAYSFSIVLLALSIFFYSKSEEYKVQFVDLTREVKEQNQKINMLINALPQVDVQGQYVQVKEVLVTPQS
ncbi:MAG: hypothetical protein Q8S39_06655 [Ignavibacteria bacterium]|nr:hypothetical protein [Ignavibacteria bacterium]